MNPKQQSCFVSIRIIREISLALLAITTNMPELPEVETVVRDLNKRIRGRIVKGFWSDWPRGVFTIYRSKKGVHRESLLLPTVKTKLIKLLRGARIGDVRRRAKNILVYLDNGTAILIHLKMTGHLLLGRWVLKRGKQVPITNGAIKEKVNSYIHFILYFKDGDMLGFSDARKFGKIVVGKEEDILSSPDLRNIGPEPLDNKFDYPTFLRIIGNSKKRAKTFLLDQSKIAGIGNIYGDDILWLSKIHPLAPIGKISKEKLKILHRSIKDILGTAVKMRGTSMSDYRDTSGERGGYMDRVLVYGRKDESCKRCKTKITRIFIGARSAHFCPDCQAL